MVKQMSPPSVKVSVPNQKAEHSVEVPVAPYKGVGGKASLNAIERCVNWLQRK